LNAHSTYGVDNAHLSAEQQEGNVLHRETVSEEDKLPQATVELSDDTRVVLLAPEIELTFSDDEPVIEVTSYY